MEPRSTSPTRYHTVDEQPTIIILDHTPAMVQLLVERARLIHTARVQCVPTGTELIAHSLRYRTVLVVVVEQPGLILSVLWAQLRAHVSASAVVWITREVRTEAEEWLRGVLPGRVLSAEAVVIELPLLVGDLLSQAHLSR